MYDAVNSKYTYKGTNVLVNKLNIKDEELLKEYETKMVSLKLATIQKQSLPEKFNIERFKFIHEYLFNEIYDFAGKFREENITKDNFRFAEYMYLEDNINLIFEKIDIVELKRITRNQLIAQISYIMTELNVLHPFSDGNGRVIREFIREILFEVDYEINFQKLDYNEIIRVSKISVIDDSEQIKLLKGAIKSYSSEDMK